MAPAPSASAIVLAGGRSSRFGRDKLAEPIDGQPLLLHAIEAVRALASEVLVIAAPDGDPDVPSDVVVVHDPSPYEGPLAGLAAGLQAANEPVCLVVGGDSPTLRADVLGLLVGALDDSSIDAAAAVHHAQLRFGDEVVAARRLAAARELDLERIARRLLAHQIGLVLGDAAVEERPVRELRGIGCHPRADLGEQ